MLVWSNMELKKKSCADAEDVKDVVSKQVSYAGKVVIKARPLRPLRPQ